jgi:hypothetical protein
MTRRDGRAFGPGAFEPGVEVVASARGETDMLTSATALILSAISAPAVGDVTPTSLAVRPPLISLTGAPYDWALQQGGGAKGLSVADSTANCNTVMSYTNGGKDHVPDCGFD